MTPFEEFDLAGAIRSSSARLGVLLDDEQVAALSAHARAVAHANARLHLTSIVEPETFVERHIAESLVGALLLEPDVRGVLVDLGSGNGYPGIPIAVVRRGLRAVLVESSPRKAAFLSTAVRAAALREATVLEANVQRPADLSPLGKIRVIATRAMGGWERLLPKLSSALEPDGQLLVWAADALDTVSRRVPWRRYRRIDERRLPGLERGRVVRFMRVPDLD